MNNNFTHDEFDDFLKESADSLRLRPSDKVWKGISKNLNERRRRMGFATGTFLLLTSFLGYFLVTDSKNNISSSTLAQVAANVNKQSNIAPADETKAFSAANSSPHTEAIAQLTTEQRTVAPVRKQAIVRRLYPQQTAPVASNEALIDQAQAEPQTAFTGTVVDSYGLNEEAAKTEALPKASEEVKEPLLTIESVTNIFKNFSRKKVSFQFFFTPTVSYRKLSENKSYLRSVPMSAAASNYAVLYNINDIVTHKPDIGLELGFTAKYPIAKSIQLRGGLQFNVNRYDIKAFDNTTELATIALNNGNNNVNLVDTRSNYRNFGSSGKENWLQNKSFQVSAPIGAEIKVAGSSKGTSFGVATTIQPTYVLGDRAYLLSSDYKNYSEVSWLMRRWNVATSVETFVAYSTGKLKWQIGPQVRYQLLSSFATEYPVKENLFDFGLKVGISLNQNQESKTDK